MATITRMQQRRDTSANWATNNPVMLLGEMGYDTDLERFKIGDGTTPWASLPFLLDHELADARESANRAEAAADTAAADASAETIAALEPTVAAVLAAQDAAADSADEARGYRDEASEISGLTDVQGAVDLYLGNQQITYDDVTTYAYPARTTNVPVKFVGPARPVIDGVHAKNGDAWIQRKGGLLTEVRSLPGIVAYYPMNEGSGTNLNDVTPTPADATVTGAGAVLGAWNQPGGVGALGFRPGGSGAVSLPSVAKMALGDVFSFGIFLRRRDLVAGTIYQHGASLYSALGSELFGNTGFESALAASPTSGNWGGTNGAAALSLDTSVKHSGAQSVKVSVDAANTTQGVGQYRDSAVPGRYVFDGWTLDDPANLNGKHSIQFSYAGAVGGITQVTAPSNGQVLPQATINVADTSRLASAGSLEVTNAAGSLQTISYTGKTGTTLTGCTGGTGTLITGGAVNQTQYLTSAGTWSPTPQAYVDLTHEAAWTQHVITFDLPDTTLAGVRGLLAQVKRHFAGAGGVAYAFWVDDAGLKMQTPVAGAFAIESSSTGVISLKVPVAGAGTRTVATSPALRDHLGHHLIVVTKNGATTKVYLDGVDVTIAGTNATIATGTVVGSILSGDAGQLPAVASHAFLVGRAISPAEVAAIWAEADHYPDRSPGALRVGTNNYSMGSPMTGTVNGIPIRTRYAKTLKALNITTSREPILWAVCEPTTPGTYVWTILDELVNALVAEGIEILPFFDVAPAWAVASSAYPSQSRTIPSDAPLVKGLSVAAAGVKYANWKAAWISFMVACVNRYKDRIHSWEVLNEMNAEIFSYPAASAPIYVDLYNAARTAILAADPTAKVGVAGLARMRSENAATGTTWYLADEWLRALLDGGIAAFDFIGGHPYTDSNSGPLVHTTAGVSVDQVVRIHDTLVEYGRTGVDVQLNEMGYYSGVASVSAASAGVALPTGTITVDEVVRVNATSGTVYTVNEAGTVQTIAYTGKSGTTTIAAASDDVALPISGGVLNVVDASLIEATSGTVYTLNNQGVLVAIAFTGKAGNTLTGCTGGSGRLVAGRTVSRNLLTGCTGGTGTLVAGAPISVSPGSVPVTDTVMGQRLADTVGVVRDYFSKWCTFVAFYSINGYNTGTPQDALDGARLWYDATLIRGKTAAISRVANAFFPFFSQAHAVNPPPAVVTPLPVRYEAIGGVWVQVAA
jgi:hypothetical protein